MRNAWWGGGWWGAKSSSSCGSTMLPWRLHPMQQSTQMASLLFLPPSLPSSLPPSFYLTVQFGVSSLKCKIKTGLCAVFLKSVPAGIDLFPACNPNPHPKPWKENTARLLMRAPAAKNGYCVVHSSHVHTLIVSFIVV